MNKVLTKTFYEFSGTLKLNSDNFDNSEYLLNLFLVINNDYLFLDIPWL